MRLTLIILAFAALSFTTALATQWSVGAGRDYAKPSAVAALVHDGDTVNIYAGSYDADVCRWSASRLLLRGVGSRAELHSKGAVYGGKAIWVIAGDNCRVSNVAFYDATCPDKNGAGIRLEGHNFSVDSCLFQHNEDGILCGALHPSTLIIERSEFSTNGAGDGFSHNLYIGNVDTLLFRFNYSHNAWIGHELKSRANVNLIYYNRLSDETNDSASRVIDLPNGGTAVLLGNVIEKGPSAVNSNVAEFGLEGYNTSLPQQLFFIHNTLVSDHANGSFWQIQSGCQLFDAENNIIVGAATWPSSTSSTTFIDHGNIIQNDASSLNFSDRKSYDYHLLKGSAAIDSGLILSSALMRPVFEYVHPCQSIIRCTNGRLDVGAFENCETSSSVEVNTVTKSSNAIFYPNPVNDFVHFTTTQKHICVFNLFGELVAEAWQSDTVSFQSLAPGTYQIVADHQAVMCIKD